MSDDGRRREGVFRTEFKARSTGTDAGLDRPQGDAEHSGGLLLREAALHGETDRFLLFRAEHLHGGHRTLSVGGERGGTIGRLLSGLRRAGCGPACFGKVVEKSVVASFGLRRR